MNPARKITPPTAISGMRAGCGKNRAATMGANAHAMTNTHRSVFGGVGTMRSGFSDMRKAPPRHAPRARSGSSDEGLVVRSGRCAAEAQARSTTSAVGGAVASYGDPSPQAAHGVRRVRRASRARAATRLEAHESASAGDAFAVPLGEGAGARTAAPLRTTSLSDGAAGSRDRASESTTSRARSPTMRAACGRSVATTPHGRDPKATTMRRHRRITDESRRGLRRKADAM